MKPRASVAAALAAAAFFAVPAAAAPAPPSSPKPASSIELIDQANKALAAHHPVLARRLMEQGAATGAPEALNGLALYADQGVGAPPDAAKARALFERAAAAGSQAARLNLGVRLMVSSDPADQGRAAAYLQGAARNPAFEPSTRYALGRMKLFGLGGIARDEAGGVDLLERSLSVDPNNDDAIYLVARAYESGWGGKLRDPARALGLFRRSATLNDPRAALYLGLMLLTGEGAARDPIEASGWLRKAAAAGSADAMAQLATLLAAGDVGVMPDPPRARAWYEKAAELGSASALKGLGMMWRQGAGGPADPDRGQAYLELAADAGDYDARHVLQQLGLGPTNGDRVGIELIKAEWLNAHAKPRPD